MLTLLALLPLTAHGAELHVPVDYNTIQDAVDASVDGDVVVTDSGAYEGAVIDKAITLRGDDQGDTELKGAGARAVVTIIEGATLEDLLIDGEGSSVGVEVAIPPLAASRDVLLRRVRVKDGKGASTAGGMIVADGDVVVESCTFEGNEAEPTLPANTGAGAILHLGGSLVIADSVFQANQGYNGGAIASDGLFTTLDLLVRNSRFCDNSAENQDGAIYSADAVTVSNTVFHGNDASDGGSVWVDGDGTLIDNTFLGNRADNGPGAGYQHVSGDALVVNNLFVDNAPGYGFYLESGTASPAAASTCTGPTASTATHCSSATCR